MLRSAGLPVAKRAGIAWLDRIQSTAPLCDFSMFTHHDSLAHPDVWCCDTCRVPLEEGQACFFSVRISARDSRIRLCLDCMYERIRIVYPGFPEPPSTLVVDAPCPS